jgi:hypothetical protein
MGLSKVSFLRGFFLDHFIAEIVPPFILDYAKRLHKRIVEAKDATLKTKKTEIVELENTITKLKEKVDKHEK